MKIKTLQHAGALGNKTVLCRVDYNLPTTPSGKVNVLADARMRESLKTLKFLIRKKAKIVILTHLGRPGGKKVSRLTLRPIAKRLEKLIRKKVIITDEIISEKNKKIIQNAHQGDVIMLENLRFDPREEKNDSTFAKKISEYGDCYVNEAFSNSHRSHASMVALPKFLPSYAGFSLKREMEKLEYLLVNCKRPFTLIMGGAKISTKLPVIHSLLPISDCILLGGALANTVLVKMKIPVGKSLIDKHSLKKITKKILDSYKIFFPLDAVCAKKIYARAQGVNKKIHMLDNNDIILDIGNETQKEYAAIIENSKTIFWNGPMGLSEYPQFRKGTQAVAKAIYRSRAHSLIGGGDIIESLKSMNLKPKKNIHFLNGGGAILEYLRNKTLPALKPLIIS